MCMFLDSDSDPVSAPDDPTELQTALDLLEAGPPSSLSNHATPLDVAVWHDAAITWFNNTAHVYPRKLVVITDRFEQKNLHSAEELDVLRQTKKPENFRRSYRWLELVRQCRQEHRRALDDVERSREDPKALARCDAGIKALKQGKDPINALFKGDGLVKPWYGIWVQALRSAGLDHPPLPSSSSHPPPSSRPSLPSITTPPPQSPALSSPLSPAPSLPSPKQPRKLRMFKSLSDFMLDTDYPTQRNSQKENRLSQPNLILPPSRAPPITYLHCLRPTAQGLTRKHGARNAASGSNTAA